MERLGVRMRVRASSTASLTAVATRVKDPSLRPSRLVATDSVTLWGGVGWMGLGWWWLEARKGRGGHVCAEDPSLRLMVPSCHSSP